MRFALVSRELAPFTGGGIAAVVAAAARQLSEVAEVTVFTSAAHRERHRRMLGEGDPRRLPESVSVVFVPEPPESAVSSGAHLSTMHAYSARAYEAMHEHYGDGGPDLVEFCDYLGEGFVTTQARRTGARWLERTLVCVRLHTSAELVDVLDGHLPDDSATVAVHEAERYVLRHADRVIWPGGDVLETYRRYYGPLAEAVRIPNAGTEDVPDEDAAGALPTAGEPLRLLYVGRLERRKGVQNLLRAVTAIERDDWHLTLVGGDTDTAAVATSMLDQLDLVASGDPRITFAEGVDPAGVDRHLRDAHVVVMPSLWECWPTVALEALRRNRPLLATPVGGHCELVQPGRSGWLTGSTATEDLQAAIEARLDDVEGTARLIAGGGPRAVAAELADPDEFRRRYAELAAGSPRRTAGGGHGGLVTIVVPYHRLEDVVDDTLHSAFGQTYPDVEVVLAVDGSLRDVDGAVIERAERLGARVVVQQNSGLGAARNLGIGQARGEYVLPLDADDMLAPAFVERCVAALEADPQLAYVTSWVRYVKPDGSPLGDDAAFVPLGGWSRLIERNNVAGTCSALIRRSVFDRGFAYSTDLTSFEDWLFYLELHHAGLDGDVVPEWLLRCRVRTDSMTREVGAMQLGRIACEVRALARERSMRWEADVERRGAAVGIR